jgi:soluble lytic murein transglycosylase-like protein
VAGVKGFAIAFLIAWTGPACAAPLDRWSEHITEASARFGVPESWIRRVIRAESGGRTMLNGRPIVSRAGAMGLMQLMPGTWREMRTVLGLGHDPHHPRDNILAGSAYLRAMYDRFGYPGLFGAYNAGPARYAEHLRTGRDLPGETVAYVASIAGPGAPVRGAAAKPPTPALFAFGAIPSSTGQPAQKARGERLFVRLAGRPED